MSAKAGIWITFGPCTKAQNPHWRFAPPALQGVIYRGCQQKTRHAQRCLSPRRVGGSCSYLERLFSWLLRRNSVIFYEIENFPSQRGRVFDFIWFLKNGNSASTRTALQFTWGLSYPLARTLIAVPVVTTGRLGIHYHLNQAETMTQSQCEEKLETKQTQHFYENYTTRIHLWYGLEITQSYPVLVLAEISLFKNQIKSKIRPRWEVNFWIP